MNSLISKKIIKNNSSKKLTQEELKEVMGIDVKFQFRRSVLKNRSPYIHFF
ncbi:MAG: hypothetical protein PF638_13360 [Candidatus Delongbacteria bacterium]|jgi:hypothetical protein|nr:hypothetical protein [Candidatus Delongbacteria bacterium]